MGNVKVMQRFIRRLTKNSNGTFSVTIPIEHAYELGWEKGDKVKVEKVKDKLVIASTRR